MFSEGSLTQIRLTATAASAAASVAFTLEDDDAVAAARIRGAEAATGRRAAAM